MASRLGHDVLSVFDVPEEAADVLCDIIESGAAPSDELERLWKQSMTGGAEDWQYLIDCATSLQQREPWGETDRLIAEARKLQDEFRQSLESPESQHDAAPGSSKHKHHNETSRFWSADSDPRCRSQWYQADGFRPAAVRAIAPSQKRNKATSSTTSPYFATPSPEKNMEERSPKRPPAGTVSCIPFPPLSSPKFGIIQEELAHSPFWLLVAITFLIKTSGQLAIPTFRRIKNKFPSPQAIGDPANAVEIVNMIRHLGLCMMRLKYLQKYARAFIQAPPQANVRYSVKHYDARDVDVDDVSVDTQAWEIGHMTQGKYALDSWRIFCRDELLSRAEDWNGKGREGEFQPEWMRVMPTDKELRAYLRWMWMREGWEWDPITGEKTVLRDEMRMAVEEGRVEYDDTGGLRILDLPRFDSNKGA